MAKTQKKRNKPAEPAVSPSRGFPLSILLLLAAVVVVGLTIYVSVNPPWARPPQPLPDGPSQAQRTRAVIESLLARADAISLDSGPQALAAQRQAYEQAVQVARKFIEMSDRTDVVVRPMLANALLRLDRMPEAERTVDELLKLSPSSAEGLLMKGQLVRRRDRRGALDYFRRAAESERATDEIWATYGAELMAFRRRDEAQVYLERAEKAGNRDHKTLFALALLAMGDNRFPRAESLLAELASRERPSPQVLALLAEAQKYLDKNAQAEKTIRKALEIREAPELRMQLADVLVLLRRREEAADTYAKASETPGLELEAGLKAARLYYLLEKYAQAMKHIDRIASAAPTPDVLEWKKRIEDARFGPTAAAELPTFDVPPIPSLLEPAPGETAPDPNAVKPLPADLFP